MPNDVGAITRLQDISRRYDAILSDVWGVVHNGIEAHQGAVDALVTYRKSGGRVVLITNASRTTPAIQAMLDDFNVPREAYDAIVTSANAAV